MPASIGERIKGLRRALQLTQVQLAKEAGVDQSVISDIEHGRGFGADVLMKICDALHASPSFIMRGGSEETMQEEQLLGSFRQCNADGKAHVLEIASAIAIKNKATKAEPFKVGRPAPAPKTKAKEK